MQEEAKTVSSQAFQQNGKSRTRNTDLSALVPPMSIGEPPPGWALERWTTASTPLTGSKRIIKYSSLAVAAV
jgi:hypothetical protein